MYNVMLKFYNAQISYKSVFTEIKISSQKIMA